MAEVRLVAEARLGEILKKDLQHGGDRKSQNQPDNRVRLKDLGFSEKESSRYQNVAKHKDLIPEVIKEARENGDLPTRRDLENRAKKRRIGLIPNSLFL